MCYRLMLGLAGFLPLVFSALGSDSTWPLDYDLFDDSSLSFNPGAVALNQGSVVFDQTLPLDPTLDNSYNPDSFGDLFDENLPPIDEANWNAPFDVADCMKSEYMPVVGRSRLRRSEGSTTCHNPAAVPTLPKITPDDGSAPVTATDVLTTDDTNSFCSTFTQGVLPWGVCGPSGGYAGTTVLNGIQHSMYFVRPCTLGMSDQPSTLYRLARMPTSRMLTQFYLSASQTTAICPKAEDKVFCCQSVTPEMYPTYAAGLCIPLASLGSRLPDR